MSLAVNLESRVVGNECILRAKVQVVVDLPVHFSHSASRVEEPLDRVLEQYAWAKRHSEALEAIKDCVDYVRRHLEDVWEQVVHQMRKCVFAAKVGDSE